MINSLLTNLLQHGESKAKAFWRYADTSWGKWANDIIYICNFIYIYVLVQWLQHYDTLYANLKARYPKYIEMSVQRYPGYWMIHPYILVSPGKLSLNDYWTPYITLFRTMNPSIRYFCILSLPATTVFQERLPLQNPFYYDKFYITLIRIFYNTYFPFSVIITNMFSE